MQSAEGVATGEIASGEVIQDERPLRILMLFHALNGGAPRSNLTLMQGLRARGHEVFAVLPAEQKDPDLEARIEACASGVTRMTVPWCFATPLGEGTAVTVKAARQLSSLEKRAQLAAANREVERLIRDLDIDLVHIGSSVTQVGLAAAKHAGVPAVWHVRELPEQQHGLVPYGWTNQAERYAEADAVVCVSHAVAGELGVDAGNVRVLWDGLPDVAVGEREESRLSTIGTRPLRVAFAGGLSGPKGIQCVLDAFDGLEAPMELDAFGGCPKLDGEQYRRRIEQTLPNVTYQGFCRDFTDRLRDYDVLIVASGFEAFGRVTAEALFRQVLVIGADCGGTPELLEDGRGILFTPGDPADLRRALRTAAEMTPEDYRGTISAGRAFAEAQLNEQAYLDGMERIYRDVLV